MAKDLTAHRCDACVIHGDPPERVAERVAEFEAVGVDLSLPRCSPQAEEVGRFAAQVIRRPVRVQAAAA